MQKGQDNGSSQKSKIFLGEARGKIKLFLIAAVPIVVLDQLSKQWVRAKSPQMELLPGFLDLITVPPNPGAAFGLFANQTFLLIIVTVAAVLIILVFLHYLSPATTLSIVSIGLILGGAVGNLIDRLRFGGVTDFIDVHLQDLFHWYTFNIADAAITVGIFTLIYSLYRAGLFKKVYEHGHRAKN